MISSLYACHENLNLQLPICFNPKPTFLELIFNFLILHTQRHELKTNFFITIFNPRLSLLILTTNLDLKLQYSTQTQRMLFYKNLKPQK
jgi:hypothetical protein